MDFQKIEKNQIKPPFTPDIDLQSEYYDEYQEVFDDDEWLDVDFLGFGYGLGVLVFLVSFRIVLFELIEGFVWRFVGGDFTYSVQFVCGGCMVFIKIWSVMKIQRKLHLS